MAADAKPAAAPRPTRALSGIQPTGRFHWGNYFGAIRQYIDLQPAVPAEGAGAAQASRACSSRRQVKAPTSGSRARMACRVSRSEAWAAPGTRGPG